jgi:hypothetical protein
VEIFGALEGALNVPHMGGEQEYADAYSDFNSFYPKRIHNNARIYNFVCMHSLCIKPATV